MLMHLQQLLKEQFLSRSADPKPPPNYNLISMKKTLLKSFDGIKLNYGDMLSWEFNNSSENPFEHIAHLYKIEKEESDLTPLQNFKREINEFFDKYDFSIEHINILKNEVIIEGINWCYDFTIDFSFNEKISNLLKSSDYKIRFKIYRFDEDAEGISVRVEAKGDYSKYMGDDEIGEIFKDDSYL